MRYLSQFSLAEWLRAEPHVAAFKVARDAVIRDLYCRKRVPGQTQFLADHRGLEGKTVAITIAYEKAWLIDLFLERFKRFLPDVAVIVADNSRTAAGAAAIEKVARAAGAAYLKLPPSPVGNINRSHGNALNWTWRNIIRPLKPRIFGLFDHDIFPVGPVNLDRLLGQQDFYGHKLSSRHGWALWAGFSIFRFAAIANRRLDFNPDMDRLLVTGGRNYRPLYRAHDPAKLRFPTFRMVAHHDPETGKTLYTETVDDWLHLVGAGHHRDKLDARSFLEKVFAASSATSPAK